MTLEPRIFETWHPAGAVLQLHRHREAYVAMVLDGAYEECSVDGTWLCEPGDLVVHPRWHLHSDRFTDSRTRVLNVLAPCPFTPGVWRARTRPSPGDLSCAESLARLLRDAAPKPPKRASPGLLRFREELSSLGSVSAAAAGAGITREHASRSYRRHFGLAPRTVRDEARLRLALSLLTTTEMPIAEIAFAAGFADQAHLTRRVRTATGRTPKLIRQEA